MGGGVWSPLRDEAMCGTHAEMICDVTYTWRVTRSCQELLLRCVPELSVGGHGGRTHRQTDTETDRQKDRQTQ